MATTTLIHGDCLEVLKTFEDLDSQEDSIVCYDGEDWCLEDIEMLSISYIDDESEEQEEP
jgi:hypothetical protein